MFLRSASASIALSEVMHSIFLKSPGFPAALIQLSSGFLYDPSLKVMLNTDSDLVFDNHDLVSQYFV